MLCSMLFDAPLDAIQRSANSQQTCTFWSDTNVALSIINRERQGLATKDNKLAMYKSEGYSQNTTIQQSRWILRALKRFI